MGISRYGVRALTITLAAAILGGCAARNLSSAVPQGAPNFATISATKRAATSGIDLVYLAVYGEVYIYSYPGGKRVGTLIQKNVVALCADTSGNVWVIKSDSRSRSTLLKYAHDGSNPITTLRLSGHADACSVDSSTGNLAVGTRNSTVAVWTNGQGSPTLYPTSPFFNEVRTLSYDGDGNLYMRSFVSRESAAWLPKNASAVTKFSITKLGAYAWDGRHFVIGPANAYTGGLTRYKLNGDSGKVVGRVSLKTCAPNYEPNFAIAGSELAVSCGIDETNSLNYYEYPRGGKPINFIDPGETGSVAISVAPSRK